MSLTFYSSFNCSVRYSLMAITLCIIYSSSVDVVIVRIDVSYENKASFEVRLVVPIS
jgi:hypothetical protein